MWRYVGEQSELSLDTLDISNACMSWKETVKDYDKNAVKRLPDVKEKKVA